MLSSELCTPSIKFLSPPNCLILLLFTWFVSSICDVAHNDDGSCNIFPPLFCFLLDNPTYGKSHYIQQISSKRYRCPDIAFIGRGNDFPLSPTRQGLCITYTKVLLISIVQCTVLKIAVCTFVLFLSAIVRSVLRFRLPFSYI